MGNHPDAAPLMLGFYLGEWIIEPRLGRLTRDGVTVHVRPQLMDLAVYLAANSGRVVSKEQIFGAVWAGQFVAESALARCVAELRRLLGDAARESTYIETIPKRGYRLIAPVSLVKADGLDAVADASGPVGAASPPAEVEGAGPVLLSQPPAGGPLEDGQPGPGLSSAPPTARDRLGRWLLVSTTPVIGLLLIAVAIGWPVGTPFTSPARERVLVSGFASRTDDPAMDDMLRLALVVQLQRSPSLQVVTDAQTRDGLRILERDPNTPLAGALAREVCQQQSAAAFVSGSVVPFGTRYALGLEAVACTTGEILAREFVEARGKDDLLNALDLAASSFRRKLADSLTAYRRASTRPEPTRQQIG